MLHRTGDNQPT